VEHTTHHLGRSIFAALMACVAYVLAYSQDVTLIYYYPMVGQWHWFPQGQELGPRITYYGWKAIGLVAGLLTLLLPRHWTARLSVDAVWIGALLLITVVCIHEGHWFFK
jgi:hypothetical protein